MSKLVIFDCDGVLVDSEIIHLNHLVELLNVHGHPITKEESFKLFGGMYTVQIRQYIEKEHSLYIPHEKWEELHDVEVLLPIFETELEPLMEETLQVLYDQRIPRCIGSNSELFMIHHKLNFTDQKRFFHDDHIFSADHVERPKPAPDLFLFAAQQMGFQPDQCVIVEDSVTGIEAALAAGMPVIGFLAASHTKNQSYIDKIKAYQIPLAYSEKEVLEQIQKR